MRTASRVRRRDERGSGASRHPERVLCGEGAMESGEWHITISTVSCLPVRPPARPSSPVPSRPVPSPPVPVCPELTLHHHQHHQQPQQQQHQQQQRAFVPQTQSFSCVPPELWPAWGCVSSLSRWGPLQCVAESKNSSVRLFWGRAAEFYRLWRQRSRQHRREILLFGAGGPASTSCLL